MTGRDRMVLMSLIVLAVLAGGWMLVVSPERQKASQAETQVAEAQQQLNNARTEAASARTAEQRYQSAYASVVSLGKAVPPLEEVPALVYELDQVSHQRDVNFNSITSSSTSSSSSSSSASGSTAAASVTPASFTQMPFTFIFKGTYFQLAHLLGQIDGFAQTPASTAGHSSTGAHDTTVAETDGIKVSGRLLTVQSVNIAIEGGTSSGGKTGSELSATITATAYVLPSSQGLTAGATPAGPASSTPAAAASAAAAGSSAPTSPAVVEGGAP